MKSRGLIRHKADQLLFRHRKKFIRSKVARKSQNCYFNTEKVSKEGIPSVFVCSNRNCSGVLCDSRFDPSVPASCQYFEPRVSVDLAKEIFEAEIATMTPSEFITKYPDIAALRWVIGDSDSESEYEPESDMCLSSGEGQTTEAHDNHPENGGVENTNPDSLQVSDYPVGHSHPTSLFHRARLFFRRVYVWVATHTTNLNIPA